MPIVKEAYAVKIEEVWRPAQTAEFQSFGGLISFFLPKVFLVAGIIFFVITIYAGFSFMRSGGSQDAHEKEKWRMVLTYGVIGLVIIFAAFWILQIINFITGGALQGIV